MKLIEQFFSKNYVSGTRLQRLTCTPGAETGIERSRGDNNVRPENMRPNREQKIVDRQRATLRSNLSRWHGDRVDEVVDQIIRDQDLVFKRLDEAGFHCERTESGTQVLMGVRAFPQRIAELLASLLPELKSCGARLTVVRSLIGHKGGLPAEPIIAIYEQPVILDLEKYRFEEVRWTVLYTLTLTKVPGLCSWLLSDRIAGEHHPRLCVEMIRAIAKQCKGPEAIEAIRRHWDCAPSVAEKALKKVSGRVRKSKPSGGPSKN
ncbi:MAG: hypothetical protein KIT74_11050 [Fimbriimonadales bacterium]|nr:hypothetical protein [Fimbriimonadales bacterium]